MAAKIRAFAIASLLTVLHTSGCHRERSDDQSKDGVPQLPEPPAGKQAIRGTLTSSFGVAMSNRQVMLVETLGRMVITNIKQSAFDDPAGRSDALGRFQILVDASACTQKPRVGDGPRTFTIALKDSDGATASVVRDAKGESVKFSCAGQRITDLGKVIAP